MRIDGAVFSIERRPVGACIDLAVVFLRAHFLPVMLLTLLFALPHCVGTWWVMTYHGWVFAACVALFGFVSPFAGAALVAAAGPRLFGDSFSIRRSLGLVLRRIIPLTLIGLTARGLTYMASTVLIFPGYLLATRYGFLAEVFLLEQCPLRKYEARLNDLLSMTYRLQLGRLIGLVAFFTVTVTCLFLLLDTASGTLLGLPVLLGRFSGLENLEVELTVFLTEDPLVGTTWIAMMWLVYPLARLAWMFCYLDVRIAQEGWDMDLAFRIEAQRLETA